MTWPTGWRRSGSTEVVKALLRQCLAPSTQRRIQSLRRSSNDFISHLWRQVSHGRQLEQYCKGKTDLLLNVGCGESVRAGWVNIDYAPHNGAFYYDALDRIPIADGTVRHIHCEHFLEHLTHDDAAAFLKECLRVLVPAGTMRIIVPDAERYMRAYCADDTEFFQKLEHLGGSVEPLRPKNMVCNQAFRMGGDHLFGWDFETIDGAARRAGFATVLRSSINDVPDAFKIDGQDWWRPIESIYVNLRK